MKGEIENILTRIKGTSEILRSSVGDYSSAMSAMFHKFGKKITDRAIRKWSEPDNGYLNVVGQYWRLIAVMWMSGNKPGAELLLAETEVFVSELQAARPRVLTETDKRIIWRQLGLKLAY